MEELEMIEAVQSIYITQGKVDFPEYQALKDQAEKLAHEIANVEVTHENIKTSKKMLAAVNKSLKELESRRIHIKKLILEPYQVFEDQVKHIIAIVKEADEIVRDQVRAMEEAEREEKQEKLMDLFQKRIVHYSFRDLFTFKDFFHPRHLNKTSSIEMVEKEIIDFLEKVSRDLNAIEKMPDAEAVLCHYTQVKDVAAAITLYAQEKQRKEQIEASKAIKKEQNIVKYLVTIPVETEKELKLLTALLEQHYFEFGIDYITAGGR
jgi:hypothetical protein